MLFAVATLFQQTPPAGERAGGPRLRTHLVSSQDFTMTTQTFLPLGVELFADVTAEQAAILTPEALAFVADLERRTRARRQQLLHLRDERQRRLDAGEMPDFLSETAGVRASDWQIGPLPADLQDRRVE